MEGPMEVTPIDPVSNYQGINAITARYLWDTTRPLPWYYRYCWYSMAWWYSSYIHVCTVYP